MFANKKLAILVVLILLIPMFLAACGPTPEPEVIVETVIETVVVEGEAQVVEKEVTKVIVETVEVPKEVQVEVTPEPEPSTRTGAWVDTMVYTEQNDAAAAVAQLNADELDIYAYTVADPEVFQTVKDSEGLEYSMSAGVTDALMFNVYGPTFIDGRLNPFSVPKVREAMHWLSDRDYIVQEIVGGLGLPQYFVTPSTFPDYTRYVDIARELEATYAYDLEKADAAITVEMEALGAEKVDGKWMYNGEPVILIFIIRTEDERRQIGDYIANQLESVGFTVDRQYKNRSEASPIWYSSDTAEGQWHLYTAGWINTLISRDDGIQFSTYFTPRGDTSSTWQSYNPSPEFDEIALKLESNDFASMEERRELFTQALELSMEDAAEVYLITTLAFTPRKADLSVTYDLAGAVAGAMLYPYTIRWEGQEGGTVRISQPGIMVNPWNPIQGSNWVYDVAVQRATSDHGVVNDPYTGLAWPQRIERAEVFAVEGLPMTKSLDWVDLKFQPEIPIPSDTWVDWDAAEQRFITAGEAYPDGATANVKTVVYYPDDLYETVKWHDGSPLSPADFVYQMIMVFDPAKEESAIYDENYVPSLDGFMSHFKGVRILSTDPLIIETYDDKYQLDAELFFPEITYPAPYTWWPQYAFGEGPWHTIAMGALAEENQELAFSTNKAGTLEVDWMNFISGPSLEILKKYLDQAASDGYIPFEPTMGNYVTADEAATRWANLQAWYDKQGHFWVNTGPFYLDKVYPVEGTLTVQRNPDYVDPSDKWARFSEPRIADVELDGPGQVPVGTEAIYDVYVTFRDAPYPNAEITEVKYLLFDATGAMVTSGLAEPIEDGLFQVVLGSDVTGGLAAGSNKLEVAVSSSVVSIPSFASYEFITVQ
jgi:peptide/nickel transport system substrate-binding protein